MREFLVGFTYRMYGIDPAATHTHFARRALYA
jgi:hypothetical protein